MWIKYHLFPIICLFASASAAPTKVSPLYNLVKSDGRLEKLRENKFVAECRRTTETVESLCFALVDVSLSFNNRSLDFTRDNTTYKDDEFCDALAASFPEGPANNDSATNGLKITWFKDILSKDSDACTSSCIYEDKETYEPKVLWMCKFLLNQYTFLNNLNKTSGENTKLVGSEAKSNEEEPVAQLVPAADPVKTVSGETSKPKETAVTKPATLAVLINEDPKIVNATEPQTKPLENSTIPAVEKKAETVKVEVPAVPVNVDIAAPEDDEAAKAAAEVKAEEAANDDAAKPDEKPKLEDPAKNLPLDNGEINQNPFDADAEEDPDNHQVEKNEGGELPYRDGDDDDDDYGGDAMARNNNNIPEVKLPQEPEPTLDDDVPRKKVKIVDFEDDPDSNFFAYLCGMMFLCVLLYILHQNRQKILALFLEGRRGNRRGSRDRSRSGSKAAYSKLDCNLEEAIMSKKSLSGKSMDIIY